MQIGLSTSETSYILFLSVSCQFVYCFKLQKKHEHIRALEPGNRSVPYSEGE